MIGAGTGPGTCRARAAPQGPLASREGSLWLRGGKYPGTPTPCPQRLPVAGLAGPWLCTSWHLGESVSLFLQLILRVVPSPFCSSASPRPPAPALSFYSTLPVLQYVQAPHPLICTHSSRLLPSYCCQCWCHRSVLRVVLVFPSPLCVLSLVI